MDCDAIDIGQFKRAKKKDVGNPGDGVARQAKILSGYPGAQWLCGAFCASSQVRR